MIQQNRRKEHLLIPVMSGLYWSGLWSYLPWVFKFVQIRWIFHFHITAWHLYKVSSIKGCKKTPELLLNSAQSDWDLSSLTVEGKLSNMELTSDSRLALVLWPTPWLSVMKHTHRSHLAKVCIGNCLEFYKQLYTAEKDKHKELQGQNTLLPNTEYHQHSQTFLTLFFSLQWWFNQNLMRRTLPKESNVLQKRKNSCFKSAKCQYNFRFVIKETIFSLNSVLYLLIYFNHA